VQIDGTPVLAMQLDAVLAMQIDVVVVTAAHHDAYVSLIGERDVTVVRNEDPDRGPFSSVQLGLRGHAGGAFVLPLDVPAPSVEVWRALKGEVSTVPTYGDRGGHPPYLSAATVAQCQTSEATARLDVLLGNARRMPVQDARVIQNLNTPEDVHALHTTHSAS
jgi:CTP:molybdopterin cytidylyltransferase MocA